MRNNFIKIFISLVFLVVSSYVSYHLFAKNSASASRLAESFSQLENYSRNDSSAKNETIKILTSEGSIEKKGRVVVESWAKYCDNYKLVTLLPTNSSTKSSNSSEPLTEPAEVGDVLRPPGLKTDTYEKLTDKVFLTYKYIYQKYGDYDWYLKADDDTFIFVDNLRKFLADKDSSKPVTFGYDFKVLVDGGYHSGGGGYLLSREALNRLGAALNQDYEFCKNTGTEDVDVARCLRSLQVATQDSVDEYKRERFHPLSITAHYYGQFPDWLIEFAKNPPRKGIECCSDSSISFHYMSSDDIQKLTRILDKLEFNTLSGQEAYTFSDILKEMGML